MGVLGRTRDDNYMPEDGILVVRDVGAGAAGDEYDGITAAHPIGTLGRSGRSWLYTAGGDGPAIVELRAWDGPPAVDAEDWTDVFEVPYESATGVVALSGLTTGPGADGLRLGDPGTYRVRAAYRQLPPAARPPVDEDDLQPEGVWQLDFWPAAESLDPPRWLRRRRAPVKKPDPGWRSLLGMQEMEVAEVVEWAGRSDGMTVDDINSWGAEHYRGPDWLSQTLGRDLSREGWPNRADIARMAGLPEPTTRRDLLPVYVALEILTFDGTRYVAVDDKRMAQDVLRLPADVAEWLKGSQAVNQFTSFAADLVSVVYWGGPEQTVAGLAERTLASEDDVRRTLQYAVDRKLLEVEWRTPDELTLTVVPHRHVF
ncbi:hypothetical protein [Kribbella sp. NPDC004875]|uniref:hypothetical protein n=1 Tax=Kribbella sp. NPDC004875 TaxID=3364107 RepID=UPI003688AA7C